MRNIILSSLFLLSSIVSAASSPVNIITVAEGVAALEAAEKLGGIVNDITDAADNSVINLVTANELETHYRDIFQSADFLKGTGLLFDVTVLESSNSDKRYVMVPVLVGSGSNSNDAALRSIIGSRVVKHETFGADLTFLKDFNKIGSLPENLSVSDKSRAIWVFKADTDEVSFHVINDGKTFWANARVKRLNLLLQKSSIKGLVTVEAIAVRSEQYSELANLYREQIQNAGISGQVTTLRTARSKAASDLADAMYKLDQASGIVRSLKGVQIIQDILSVAAIVNNAAQSAANQAQLDQIQADVSNLKGEMAQLKNSISNIEVRIGYLESSVGNLSRQLNGLENSLNRIFLDRIKLNSDVVPEPQTIIVP